MTSPIPVAAPIDVSNPSTQAFGFALPCNNEVVFDVGYVRGGPGTQGGNIYGAWSEVLQTLGTLYVGSSASTQLIKVQADATLPAGPTFALSYPRIVGANTPASIHPPYPQLDLGSTSCTFIGELQIEDCDLTASAGAQISAAAPTVYPTIRIYGPPENEVVVSSGTSAALIDITGMDFIVYVNNGVLGDSVNPVFTDSVGGGSVTIFADNGAVFYDNIFDATIDIATSVFVDIIGTNVLVESISGSMPALLGNTFIAAGSTLTYISTDPVTDVGLDTGGPTTGAFVVDGQVGIVYFGQNAIWNTLGPQSGQGSLVTGTGVSNPIPAYLLSSSKIFVTYSEPLGVQGVLIARSADIVPGSPGSFVVRSFVANANNVANTADESGFYWQVIE